MSTTPQGSLADRDARHTWHPYTQHGIECEPLAVVKAYGATLELADGSTLIDAISSWWTCLHGHGIPRLVDAISKQAAQLDHVLFAGATHEPAVRLAEELVAVVPGAGGPSPLSRVFYSDNGSTAVEVALKMSYQAWLHAGEPQRTVFISLEGSYHGDTFGAMSVGDPVPFFEPFGDFLFEVRRVKPTAEALEQAIAELGERAAAVILEPLVQGAAGMVMHPPSFVAAARKACDTNGLFLIADEVMTGFGRTGTLFACEQAGVRPDLLCLAKGLTGGILPLAVTLATERVFEAFLSDDRSRFFPHGHSMTANPIGCALALASLELSRETQVERRLEHIGKRIEAGLESLRDVSHVRDLRRLGGIVAFDLIPEAGESGGYMASITPRLRAAAIELGVLLRPLGNVVYALPPACTTDEECDRISHAMVEMVAVQPA